MTQKNGFRTRSHIFPLVSKSSVSEGAEEENKGGKHTGKWENEKQTAAELCE